MRLDESEVYKWFDLFKGNSQLTEIRLISNDGKTGSGYFTDAKTLIDAIKPYTDNYNVYFSVNRINPECYGREQRNRIVIRPKNTTTDNEIVGRDWVYIDFDAKRVTGSNADDNQVELAKQKANKVYAFLKHNGFNDPIVVFSGNGVHFYLKCALKPTEENNNIVKRFIQSIGMLFSDENIEIDQKIFNLGRISRLPGSYSAKGSNTDKDRPQRMCKIVKYPSEIKVNDIEYFKKIADLLPEDEVTPNRDNNYSSEKFDLEDFIRRHNIPVVGKSQVSDGTRYYLKHCLFDENHKGKDAILFQRNNGAIAYYCFHNSCAGNDWKKVRLMYEPNAYDKKYTQQRQNTFGQKQIFTPILETEEKGKKWLSLKDVKRVDISELMSIPTGYNELDKKIIGLFAGELTVLSGLNASGKTSWLDCLALNVIQDGYKVAIWSGEMQDWRFQGWINQMAAGKNYVRKKDGYDNFYYVPNGIAQKVDEWLDGKLFLYNNSYGSKWEQIFNDVKEVVDKEKTQLVVLDNLAALCIDGYEGEKYSKQTKFILDLKDYAKQTNIHVILVAHPRKQNDFLRKEGISGTADLTNIADNVFLCHRVNRDFEKRAGEFLGVDKVQEYLNYSSVLEVAKNRQMGIVDHLVGMYYEAETRRLKNSIAETIHYGWEEEPIQQTVDFSTMDIEPNYDFMSSGSSNVDSDDECPF